MSRDFPLHAYNSVHMQVNRARLRSKKKRSEFGRAWNAVAYASFSLGSALVPSHFPMNTQRDLRKINLRYTSRKFISSSYSSDAISRKFDQLKRSRPWDNWSKIRNILIHRQQPSRSFGSENDTWHGKFVIDDQITKDHRVWVSQVTQGLVSALDDFCSNYL